MIRPDVPPARWNRAMLALGVAALHLLLGYILIAGLAAHLPAKLQEAITVITLRPPKPIEPVAEKPRGEAAPANRRADPVPVASPSPVVPVEPPPILAAPVAGPGDAATSGAAPLAGPGTGGGGEGFGTGSGGGDGAGGGGTPARWLSGRIKPSDYPERAFDAGIEGITGVRLTISARGRVTACTVTHPSGSDELDATTCRLLLKRSRYEPARDAWGRAVEEREDGAQEWRVQGRDDRDRD